MAATGYFRGHLAYYDESQGEWLYADTDMPVDDSRPCPQCHKLPTEAGYDACLGYIPGATSACCGHGIKDKYIIWSNDA